MTPADPAPAEVMAHLATPEGRRLISAARAAATAHPDPIAAITALRRREPDVSPALLAAAMTQVGLRQRHADRLGPHVEELLLTTDGVQQATRWSVAQHRAQRLHERGVTSVADLSCGLGLDLRAMSDSGLRVVGVERDPTTAIAAAANAPGARIITGDCTDPAVLADALSTSEAAFVDPARRDPAGPRDARGGRARPERDPALWSPPWPWVTALAERVPQLVAKVAPGMPPTLAPAGAQIEWVSVEGDLVEACVWFPALASGTSRRATIISGSIVTSIESNDNHPQVIDAPMITPSSPQVDDLLLEPDPAVIRAALVDQLSHHLSPHIQRIPGTDWLQISGGDTTIEGRVGATPLGTAYRIVEIVPTVERELRTHLERAGYADLVLKVRGVKIDAVQFTARARPRTRNGPRATVVILPGPTGRPTSYLVEPLAMRASRPI